MAILGPIERIGAAAVVLLLSGAARAEAPGVELVVTRGPGAEDCPDTSGIGERVRAITRGDPFATNEASPPGTWIQVALLRELAGYRAVITAQGKRQGTRVIEDVGTSCGSIADAVAITLVMLLDHGVVGQPAPSLAVPAAPPPSAPPPPPVPRDPFLRVGAEVGGGASLGLLYHAAPLIEGGARLTLGRDWLVGAGASYVFPDRVIAPGGAVSLGLWYVYLRGGYAVFSGRGTGLWLVVGPLLGSLSGEGADYETHSTRRAFWGAAAAGAEVVSLLGAGFSFSTRLLGVVEPTSQGFSTKLGTDESDAFRTSPFSALLTVSASFQR